MHRPGEHVLLRYHSFRGWWIDTGFGMAERQQFFANQAEALCAAYALSKKLNGQVRVLVQDGAGWKEPDPPVLLDFPMCPPENPSVRLRNTTV